MFNKKDALTVFLGGIGTGALGLVLSIWRPQPLHFMGDSWDCAFFIGLLLLIVGLFALMRGSPAGAAISSSSNASAQGAFMANVAAEEERQSAKGNTRHRRGLELNKPGLILLLGGVINLLVGLIAGRIA